MRVSAYAIYVSYKKKKPIVASRRNDYNEIGVFRIVNEITNDTKLATFRQHVSALLVYCSMIISLSSVCFANSGFFQRNTQVSLLALNKGLKL